jgi:hypothetical protein
MVRLLAVVVFSLLVLGCLPPPAAPATPSMTSAPASAEPSASQGASLALEQAAAAYSAIAERYNVEIDRADELYDPRASLKDHQRYWALIAKADATYLEGVKEIAFPPGVQVAATTLIKADTAFQRRALAASRAGSPAEAISLSAAANDAADAAADKADILREALGLEPNP